MVDLAFSCIMTGGSAVPLFPLELVWLWNKGGGGDVGRPRETRGKWWRETEMRARAGLNSWSLETCCPRASLSSASSPPGCLVQTSDFLS